MSDKVSILYLEDEIGVQQAIKSFVSMVYPNIRCVENGLKGLIEIENGFLPDIIITDINMPKMNGLDFIEALEKKNINIPVIITSANILEKDSFDKTKYPSIYGILHKPIDVRKLISLCDDCLSV
jgi:DNA-binding NtrC family response regulator